MKAGFDELGVLSDNYPMLLRPEPSALNKAKCTDAKTTAKDDPACILSACSKFQTIDGNHRREALQMLSACVCATGHNDEAAQKGGEHPAGALTGDSMEGMHRRRWAAQRGLQEAEPAA